MEDLQTLLDELKAEDKRFSNPATLPTTKEQRRAMIEEWRQRVSRLQGNIGAYGPEAVAPLLAIAEDKNNRQSRSIAVAILGQIQDKRAVAPLLNLIDEEDGLLSFGILADTLGSLGDTRAVEPLIEALEHAEERVDRDRQRDNKRLGHGLIVTSFRFVNRILDFMFAVHHTRIYRATTCASCADALGKLGDKRAIEPLKRRRRDWDAQVRKAVQKALAKLEAAERNTV